MSIKSIISNSNLASILRPETPPNQHQSALATAINNYLTASISMDGGAPPSANFPAGIALINALNAYTSATIEKMLNLSLDGNIFDTKAGNYNGGAIAQALYNRYKFIMASGVVGLESAICTAINGSVSSAAGSMTNTSGGMTIVFNEGNFVGPIVTAINNYGEPNPISLDATPNIIHITSTGG